MLNLSRLRLLGDFRETQGNAVADAIDAVRRVEPVPVRRPIIRGLAVPTAATVHAARAPFRARWITDGTLGVFVEPIATPLKDIPMHVAETPSVCFLLAHRVRLIVTVLIKPSIVAQ